MAILCCCPQLRHKRKPQNEDDAGQDLEQQGLPTRPPPARLPPPAPNGLALSPHSTAARSSLTNSLPGAEADALVHLAELVLEDSEDDNGDDALAHSSRNRSTSTLDAVKARILRHLSQDSLSRLSESEEQMARRAEVKRLMRKRIQEELQSESSPILSSTSTLQHFAPPCIASATVFGNGPRDAIEFTVYEVTRDKELATANSAYLSKPSDSEDRHISRTISKPSSSRAISKEDLCSGSHPNSLPDCFEHDLITGWSEYRRHLRQCSSLPEIPVSPRSQPLCVVSPHDVASLASWQRSLGADILADLLDPDVSQYLFRPVIRPDGSCDTLDAETEDRQPPRRISTASPPSVRIASSVDKLDLSRVSIETNRRRRRIPKSCSLVRDESPVGLWLRAQSQQFRISTASPLQGEHQSDVESSVHSRNVPADPSCAGKAPHRQLESPISPQGSRSVAPEHRAASAPLLVGHVGAETVQIYSNERDANQYICPDNTPSGASLAALSYEASQTPTKVDASVPWQKVGRRDFAAYAGLRLPSSRWHHSSSKGREEADPGPVEEHFHDLQVRKEPPNPPESTFREIMSDIPRFLARNSLLPRLGLTLPAESDIVIENFDGNGSVHDALSPPTAEIENRESRGLNISGLGHLKVPSTEYDKGKSIRSGFRLSNTSDDSPRTRGFSSSRDGDETAEMWKRVLRAESVSKSPRRSTPAQPVISELDNRQVLRAPCPSEIGAGRGFGSPIHSPTCTELPTQDDEAAFRQSLVKSNTILEDWGRQLEKQEQEAKTKTHPLTSGYRYDHKNSLLPPASWARFPSHNREERNATAGELDNVKLRDFAVRNVSAAGGTSWATDKDEDGAPDHRSIIRSVSDKFTSRFKSRWSKVIPGRVRTHSKDRSIRGARRSSIQASGYLEYPELELLPTVGGYRELLALEREITQIKGVVDQNMRTSSDESGTPGTRRSFVEDIAGALHHDGSSDVAARRPRDMAGFLDAKYSSDRVCLPVTPANQTAFSARAQDIHLTDSSGERYATPFTHVSLSRQPTPQTTEHLPTAAYTPDSTRSTAFVVRHTSVYVPKKTSDLGMDITSLDLKGDRSSIRRRSAPTFSPSFD